MKQNKITEFESFLHSAQNEASGGFNSDIANRRSRLMERYNADPYGDEVPDRSQYRATTIRDVIESVKPDLMDIFFGGDKVVEFTPRGGEDVDAAEQETAVVNYVIMEQNEGYKVFLDWFHDALLLKNGYVKRRWDKRVTTEVEEYENLDQMEMDAITQQLAGDPDIPDEGIEILEMEGGEVPVLDEAGAPALQMGPMGLPVPITEFQPINAKLRVRREINKYRVESVPPEEVLVHPEWTRLDFDGCPFHAHKKQISISDLIADGFDRKMVEALPEHDNLYDSPEKNTRFSNVNSEETSVSTDHSSSMKEVLIYENYLYHDMDDDGIAELLQVYTDENGKILKRDKKWAIEQVNGSPFNVISPFPIPHAHYGLSMAELVEDLQRLETWITRQYMDNMAIHNNPDTYVDVSMGVSPELSKALGSTAQGRVIPEGRAGQVRTEQPISIGMNALQALEHFNAVKERRSGVTAYNQGLDANSLNKTATGVNQILTQSQKKLLLVARTFAETGIKKLFTDVHRDLRKGPVKQLAIKLRNEWVSANPRAWRERMDMSVSVGLGTGDKARQAEALMTVFGVQREMMSADPTGEVSGVKPPNIHHTITRYLEMMGFKDTESFFPEPAAEVPPPQPQEDPAEKIAQLELQKEQIKAQDAESERQFKLGLEQMKLDASLETSAAKMAVDAQIAREKIASDQSITMAKQGITSLPQPVVDEKGSDAMERLFGSLGGVIAKLSEDKPKIPLNIMVDRDESGRMQGLREVSE